MQAAGRDRGGAAGFDRRKIPAEARESHWIAPDGTTIRRIDWRHGAGPARGSILFMPGRGDCYEKYLETLDDWYRRGWDVTSMDWRGQAGSGRLGHDAVTGHIADFSVWTDDLAAAWRQWRTDSPGPHVLAGHSMGGHLALRAVADGLVEPDAMVLIAPMMGFLPAFAPTGLLYGAARLMTRIGDSARPAWKWSEKPGALPADRSELLTHDARRYADEEWWRAARPELVMGPGSWGWIERALASIARLERPGVLESVMTPVLILATRADRLVSWPAIDRAARRLPHATLVHWDDEARHEILRETDAVRDAALDAIDMFLARVAPPPGTEASGQACPA